MTIFALSGLSESESAQIYREVNGKSSPSGQSPHNDMWYFSSPRILVQTSIFFALYRVQRDFNNGENWEESFLHSYEYYSLAVGGKPLLDPERAYKLIRLHDNVKSFSRGKLRQFKLLPCQQCSTHILAQGHQISLICPICKGRHMRGRTARHQRPILSAS